MRSGSKVLLLAIITLALELAALLGGAFSPKAGASGSTPNGAWHVYVRPLKCLRAEDSAGHLRLVRYDRANHVITYTCASSGY